MKCKTVSDVVFMMQTISERADGDVVVVSKSAWNKIAELLAAADEGLCAARRILEE